MSSRLRVFDSSVGTKIAIGLTGLALLLYLVTHIAGNLLVFLGPRVFNQYSHMLLSNPLIPVIGGRLDASTNSGWKPAAVSIAWNRIARSAMWP